MKLVLRKVTSIVFPILSIQFRKYGSEYFVRNKHSYGEVPDLDK